MAAIDRDEVLRLMERGAQIVETLEPSEYERAHLPGAVNIPLKHIERAKTELRRDQPVVVYCYDSL